MGSNGREHRRGVPRPPPLSLYNRDWEEEEALKASRPMPSTSTMAVASSTNKKRLTKQLSMKETTREVKWEKRRRQIQRQRSSMGLNEADDMAGGNNTVCPAHGNVSSSTEQVTKRLTDEDLDELKGSMDLGFRFDEQKGGQDLCDTLPALDLYFAVNRQLSEPKMRWSTSSAPSLSSTKSSPNLCGTPTPGSPTSAHSNPMDSWKICIPGDNPQLVKTRLRHWAQVVACSVKHSS